MQLRDYQIRVLNELETRPEKELVLAAAPSSGKTFTAIEYIKRYPEKTFLILTHGTNILKSQWEQELANHGVIANTPDSKVRFGIPQELYRKELTKVDVLIIDEAHEFNFAKTPNKVETYESMVNQIKQQIQPDKSIYLTGTPSKFIKNGMKPIIIPAIELIQQGYVSDLYVSLVSTNADLSNYKADDNLKRSSVKSLEKHVDSTMDNLLNALFDRLSEPYLLKQNPSIRDRLPFSFIRLQTELQKTMIACESVAQSTKVEAYLRSKNIGVVHSNHKNDPDSKLIDLFVENPHIKVLVVVQRGILGFNMPELVNVVDMTGSRNIDRVYQLFARVMRKHDKLKHKYFFKITDEPNREMTKFYLNAALQLMMPDFISKYNGKNLGDCEVPVFVPRKPPKKGVWDKFKTAQDFMDWGIERYKSFPNWSRNHRASHKKAESLNLIEELSAILAWPIPKKTASGGGGTTIIDPIFEQQVLAGAMLIDIWNKANRALNEYAYVRFSEIRDRIRYKDTPWKNFKIVQDFIDWGELQKRKITGLHDWEKKHVASYQKARQLQIQREVVKALGLKIKGGV